MLRNLGFSFLKKATCVLRGLDLNWEHFKCALLWTAGGQRMGFRWLPMDRRRESVARQTTTTSPSVCESWNSVAEGIEYRVAATADICFCCCETPTMAVYLLWPLQSPSPSCSADDCYCKVWQLCCYWRLFCLAVDKWQSDYCECMLSPIRFLPSPLINSAEIGIGRGVEHWARRVGLISCWLWYCRLISKTLNILTVMH